jgi:hypothetical protein
MDIEATVIIPIITFLFGILSAPIVDYCHHQARKRRNQKLLLAELNDETTWLAERIVTMAESFISLERGYEKMLKYVPRVTTVRFIEHVLNESYIDVPREKRTVLKSMIVQINSINQNADKIKKLSIANTDHHNEIVKMAKDYVYTACCLRHCMLSYQDGKKYKFIQDIEDKEAIELQIQELCLDITYDSLITRKQIPA